MSFVLNKALHVADRDEALRKVRCRVRPRDSKHAAVAADVLFVKGSSCKCTLPSSRFARLFN
jgi:hypothetical protein